MRLLRCSIVFAAGLACSGCFQLATTLRVKADGSGTIHQRLLFTKAAIAQLQQIAVLGGKEGFDPLSEEEARAEAQRFGPGVTLLSTAPISDDSSQGRESLYAFPDANQLRISQQPGLPAGTVRELDGAAGDAITNRFTKQPDGSARLTIAVPEPPIPGAQTAGGASRAPTSEQFGMVRQMFKGARVSVRVEPAGTLVATNSAYVDGTAVTLMDVDLDQLMADETLPDRLQAARTADEMKAILKDAPGLKINLDREVTIEFKP